MSKAVGLAKRLYEGAHQSKIDADTAAKVIGYTSSSSGAGAGAIGALRQYGLVDGLRGDINISDLAMRILQPMDAEEHIAALHTAANYPEVFSQVLRQFPDELPKSDAPILAYLVRHLGFSQSGANEVVSVLRETFDELPDFPDDLDESEDEPLPDVEVRVKQPSPADNSISSYPSGIETDEVIALPLGSDCRAEIRFSGEVTRKTYDHLIRHLELLRETLFEG
ncbi:hypothetical protein [Altererythrobacter fulvus]|uniref:hypothetical protein n=1 Tax=Caenibius fulvus TaxID=2126012 RepID=UPI003018F0FA